MSTSLLVEKVSVEKVSVEKMSVEKTSRCLFKNINFQLQRFLQYVHA